MVSTAELKQVMREMTSYIVQAIGESHSSINENLRLANNVQDKVKRTRNIQPRQKCSRSRSQVSQGNASSSDSSESEEDLGLSRGCTNTHIQEKGLFVLFVCFIALRPKSTAMVIAGRSVHLSTLFPGQA